MNIVLFYIESFVRGLVFLILIPIVIITLILLLIVLNKDK